VLPIGPHERQVQAVRRGQGKPDVLVISPATEQWLRHGYRARMSTPAVIRDLGAILAHGEPETGMGQGEAAENTTDPAEHATPAGQSAGESGDPAGVTTLRPADQFAGQADPPSGWDATSNGQAPVSIDFGDYGPPPAA